MRAALSQLAARQQGLFSVTQAKQIGVSNAQLLRAEAAGQLRRARRGVYATAGVPPTRSEGIIGAALAVGPEAVVSHGSAAALHRFEYGAQELTCGVELTVKRGRGVRLPGVVVHRAVDLRPDDVVRERGVLVTSSCRTLVDISGRLGPVLTERLLDEGLIARRWTVSRVQECLSRARQNVPGRESLERLLWARGSDAS